MLKNYKVNLKVALYIKLIYYISVFLSTTREYIKIVVRTLDRKRREIYLNNDNIIFLINSKLVKNIYFTLYIIKNVNFIDVNN